MRWLDEGVLGSWAFIHSERDIAALFNEYNNIIDNNICDFRGTVWADELKGAHFTASAFGRQELNALGGRAWLTLARGGVADDERQSMDARYVCEHW